MLNVLTSRYNKYCLTLFVLLLTTCSYAQVRILFDATKAEMAGNADWVLDADQTNLGIGSGGPYLTSAGHQSNAQQIPTPAQSGISANTSETYWAGALSAWGVDCAKKGYTVETLPWNGQITYGNTANAQDLSNYQVYIIDEPNLVFTADEKTAIIQFVQHGGGLFIISDHNSSDRNGDGWDSPSIWNDFFSNNSVSVNPFGITFDLYDFSQTTTNISATSTDPIIHGTMGNVTMAQWSGGTTMTLDPTKNPSIKGVIYKTGGGQTNTNAMVAYGTYGSGKIAAMGDSSPSDDGTGNPTCTLYNGYTGDASGNHRLLLMNITIWLAATHPSNIANAIGEDMRITVYPNPAQGSSHLIADAELTNVSITVYDLTGNKVKTETLQHLNKREPYILSLASGTYFVSITSNETIQTVKTTIY